MEALEKEQDYFYYVKRRLEGREEGVPGWLGDKSRTKGFADAIGVKTPQEYICATLEKINPELLPEKFVIKPMYASTSIGVYLLEKAEDKFIDLVRQKEISWQYIKESYIEVENYYKKDRETAKYVVEELLVGVDGNFPPADIRAYMFQDQCGLILMEDHISGKAEATYFNGDFSPMLDVHERFGVAKGVEHLEEICDVSRPDNYREILNVAKRIGVAVPSAFCRFDLYNTQNGIYLGEITFYPGTFYYKNRKLMFDEDAKRLGGLWREATEKIQGSNLTPAPRS